MPEGIEQAPGQQPDDQSAQMNGMVPEGEAQEGFIHRGRNRRSEGGACFFRARKQNPEGKACSSLYLCLFHARARGFNKHDLDQ